MYFGGSSFAAAPFGATAGQSIRAAVTGSRVNFSIGNTTIIEGVGVIVTPDGSQVNISTGDPTIVA